MLRLEKYGRIDFSLGRWATTDQNAPKSMRAHARESFELARTFFRSLSKSQQPLFQRSSFRLHQNGVNFTWICFVRYSIFLVCSISSICPAPPLHWATLPGSKYMFFGTKYCLSTPLKLFFWHISAQRSSNYWILILWRGRCDACGVVGGVVLFKQANAGVVK